MSIETSTQDAVQISRSELAQIVESVFVTMLGLAAVEDKTPCFPSTDRLTASVHLTGTWNGAVLVECDSRQACRLATRFLSMDTEPDSVDDVVRDVLGELANMIGGNLKCVLTPGIKLSIPSVADGSNYMLRVCGAQIQERFAFRCLDGVFWIAVATTPC